ncbi:MAG: TspO/MBR family protein [Candidatus Shapirobacteria bacterium]
MNIKKLLISLLIPLFIGYFGSIFTISQIPTWYLGINKPELLPPNGIFGPVWTILYILMGVSLYFVWTAKTKKSKKVAFSVFGIQLVLNLLWSIIFFNYHWLFLAVIEILLLWVMILVNIVKFRVISEKASWLLYPYLIWVTFASYLTISVWLLN